jgi:hypothetical protein
MTCQTLMIEKVPLGPTRDRTVVLTPCDHGMSESVPVLIKKLRMAILPFYPSRPERFPFCLLNYHS